MSRIQILCAACLTLLVLQQAHGEDDASQLRNQMIDAYAQVTTYQANVTFEVSQKKRRWRLVQDFRVAYDRTGNQLLVDKPDSVVISDGKRLYIRADQVPGRHLDVAVPQPLTYSSLMKTAPYIRFPQLPDIAFLLGNDPTAFSTRVKVLAPDREDDWLRLQYQTIEGDRVLYVDPQSHLITGAKWRVGGANGGPLNQKAAILTLKIDILKHNEQFEEDLFVFDSTNSMPVGAFRDLIRGDVPAGKEMEGKDAPAIDLNKLNGDAFVLSKAEADVIVLDFWATWCMPCHRSLAAMQEVHEWARREGKSVLVVAVNLEEPSDDVEAFWKWKKYTMPTILDVEGKVTKAYQVGPIPHTVIIHDGKIKHVHIGLMPNTQQLIKDQIEQILTSELAGVDPGSS